MEVHQHQVGAGDDPLGGGVKDIQDPIGTGMAGAHGMGGINANGHARESLDHRHMAEIQQVAVGIAHMGLEAAETENDIAVAFTGEVFGRVQRFVQGDAETALEQHRHVPLPTGGFEQLEILRVARADLEHHAGRVAGARQGVLDFLDVGLAGDFHGDYPDAIFSRQLEHPGQARRPMALEGIGIGARLVGAHAGADLTVIAQGAHHALHMLGGVHRAQASQHMQRVLPELHAVVDEFTGPAVVPMASQDTVGLGHPHHPIHARQHGHFGFLQGSGLADQIDFGEDLLGAFFLVHPPLDAGQGVQALGKFRERRAFGNDFGLQD